MLKVKELTKHILSKPNVQKIAVISNVVSNTRVDLMARGLVKGILEAGRVPAETVAVFRVPGAWDRFELAVRAVLGQQVTVRGATRLPVVWCDVSAGRSRRTKRRRPKSKRGSSRRSSAPRLLARRLQRNRPGSSLGPPIWSTPTWWSIQGNMRSLGWCRSKRCCAVGRSWWPMTPVAPRLSGEPAAVKW